MGGIVPGGGGGSSGPMPGVASGVGGAAPDLSKQNIVAGGVRMGAETLLTQNSPNQGTIRFNGRDQVYRTNLAVPGVAPVDPANPATKLYPDQPDRTESAANEPGRESGGFGDVGEPGGERLGGGGGAP